MKTQNIILGNIAIICTSQAAVNELIQETAIDVIGHAMLYGDVTLGDRLLDAARGADRKAIVTYLSTFGPFKVDGETGTFKLNKKFRDEHEFNEQGLTDGVKWYSFVPDKKSVMSSFDVGKRVVSVLKAAREKQNEGKPVDNIELVDYITAAIKKYNGDVAEAKRALFDKNEQQEQLAA